MNLRRKLLTTVGALGFLGLVIAGVTVWAVGQWQSSNENLRGHYARSLEVQQIRATSFLAFKEVSDAVAEGDADAEQEFREIVRPIEGDFESWSALAATAEERRQVGGVRDAYDAFMRDADEVFVLVENGERAAAVEMVENRFEEETVPAFERATEEAIASDEAARDGVRAQAENTRQTAQLVLFGASFGMISLILLLAAYLASDLFGPLREVEEALGDAERGDLDRRLPEERSDEIGAVNRAFNRMVGSFSRRERTENLALASAGAFPDDGEDGPGWQTAPSRVTLHRLVSQLRSRVANLSEQAPNGAGNGAPERRELVGELDRLSQAVARVTEFGFPLDLDLARTDMRALLYRVFMRFQDEFAERAVSLEFDVAPEVDHAVVDRLKLREALAELLRNALNALPERGGRLGLRAGVSEDGTELVIEVADEGAGAEEPLLGEVLDDAGGTRPDDRRPRVGLTMTKAIIEQHGGQLEIDSEPGQGTYVQTRLPLRK